jgi:hypothetical protein
VEPCFRGAVARSPGRGDESESRRHEHQRIHLRPASQGVTREVNGSREIDGDLVIKTRGRQRVLDEIPVDDGAGIVDEDVETAETFRDCIQKQNALPWIGHVCANCKSIGMRCGETVKRFRGAAADRDQRPTADECLGEAEADA